MDVTDLDAIKKDYENVNEYFSEMLTLWLKRVNPPPTWSALVGALKEPAVGFEELAERVEGKYLCQGGEALGTTDSSSARGTTGESISCNKLYLFSLVTRLL